jgi:pimeloyl-ACP methyl ester carboxylesterase
MQRMREQYSLDEDEPFDDAPISEGVSEYERIPLPNFVKKRVMKHFLQEAHDYLYNKNGMRDVIRQRVLDALNQAAQAGGPVVLVGHSQGSFIAYDVLTGVSDCPEIAGLMTFGSPLGVDEVQDRLVWTRDNGFPAKVSGDWVNVYDPFDVVSRLDPKLANDFKKNGERAVIDVKEENWGKWRHSATKYLKGSGLRGHLRRLADRV